MKLDRVARKLTEQWYELISQQIETATSDFRTKVLDEIILDEMGAVAIHPENCRFLYQDAATVIAVIEQKPQMRSIYINNYTANRLSFPYVVFIITLRRDVYGYQFRELKMAYGNKALASMQDMLYRHNLPNHATMSGGGYDGTTVCMGHNWASSNTIRVDDELPKAINKVIAHFWQSLWTGGITPRKSPLTTVESWKRESKKNPLFIMGVKWSKLRSLDAILKKLISQHGKSDVRKSMSDLYSRCWKAVGRAVTPTTAEAAIGATLRKTVDSEVDRAVKQVIKSLKSKKARAEAEAAMTKLKKQ